MTKPIKTISPMLLKITELLNDSDYHDVTDMSTQLNISPDMILKTITKLQQFGIILDLKDQGYRLQEHLLLLDKTKIQSQLDHRAISIDILATIDSTNNYLKSLTHENKQIRVCLSEHQTQGKGQLNRHWHSPFAKNIYLSLLYPMPKEVSELSGLSLVIGLAVCHAIESVINLNNNKLSLKWPNDILSAMSKLAGTLIEIQTEPNQAFQVIIGIGLNVNMSDEDSPIDQPWTSLLKLTSQLHDRNLLCAALINSLIEYTKRFIEGGLNAFMQEWQYKASTIGQTITVVSGSSKIVGMNLGINQQGHLLLKTSDGSIQAYSSGEVTIAK